MEVSHQLDNLRLDRVRIDKIYLTLEDIDKIESIEETELSESLQNAKDWLIISCFTGQRVSDFMRFNSSMIRIEDGIKYIEFTQQKTSKKMTLPLHPKVIEILDKRGGEFPYKISDQKYNDFIKVVCKTAGLNQSTSGSKVVDVDGKGKYRKQEGVYEKWELVTSHIGRRSFATNFYGTIPTTYLIYATGHSSESEFLNYIGKSNKDLAKELFNYFKI
ncbi:tyrosine-type recombinase/integrase [Flavobacterium agricola]|uniref:Tyrosine-type recombinase/integrase n=1 Tax=Flavobacterium agricola TaxID=2870839 RepID=A0ABY6LZX3_9FLAO|nr:tyrosine-type recombinase/integrase [Flavobacterium agricola]UYW01756.1 tyrosine-type recombinase/integrase [Flavobacterium agricola]